MHTNYVKLHCVHTQMINKYIVECNINIEYCTMQQSSSHRVALGMEIHAADHQAQILKLQTIFLRIGVECLR